MRINYLVYEGMTPLDLIGPAQIWATIPGVKTQFIAATLEPLVTDVGLTIQPTHSYKSAAQNPDIFFVPGGTNATLDLAQNQEALNFVQAQGESAAWVTSVCTGALVLASAGLLDGYKATTHWAALPLLERYGVEVVKERWVIDRNRATGGGVTAGIDFGLALMAEIFGEDAAKQAQLGVEYRPSPPFDSGGPELASSENLNAVLKGFGLSE